MTTLGLIFLPQLAPERLREVTRAADTAGLDELWLWEDCFFESGIASAAAALAWTERVRVGIGLLPVPLRNVALTAMEMATLQRLFPGRARIAVGHGVQSWMGQVGARAGSPLTLLREQLTALRALLDGQEVSTKGRYVPRTARWRNGPPFIALVRRVR
jgi:alkanesulfonate monooxygenase SsuD/methylene tetrahydromethanopterin reductase-like flavin-dependent oxidoreductase (luciferase family)